MLRHRKYPKYIFFPRVTPLNPYPTFEVRILYEIGFKNDICRQHLSHNCFKFWQLYISMFWKISLCTILRRRNEPGIFKHFD